MRAMPQRAASKPPQYLAISLLRTLCRAWTTMAWFHNHIVACDFCQTPDNDIQTIMWSALSFACGFQRRAGWHTQARDASMQDRPRSEAVALE